jgi:hypothetical protein
VAASLALDVRPALRARLRCAQNDRTEVLMNFEVALELPEREQARGLRESHSAAGKL